MEDKLEGYIKRTITFLIPTQTGDHFLNKDDYEFYELKKKDMFVVEEKIKE